MRRMPRTSGGVARIASGLIVISFKIRRMGGLVFARGRLGQVLTLDRGFFLLVQSIPLGLALLLRSNRCRHFHHPVRCLPK